MAWQTIGVWSAAAFVTVMALALLARPVAALADNAIRAMRRSPISSLGGTLFLTVFVAYAGTKPAPDPDPTPEPVVTNRVTYVLGGGVNAPGNPSSFTTNDLPVVLSAPMREGYDFTGWLPSDTIPAGTVTDVTYTATWEAIPPPPPPERQPWPEASEWERIDIDAEYTTIENEDKSRRNSAIPVDTVGDVVVPNVLKLHRVVSIGTRAFYGCGQITSVNIPEGVTNIADYAFYNCTSLTNVVFPSTLKSIGAYAFVGCGQLKQVHIEVPRLVMGERAFRNCDGIQTVRFVGDELIASTRAFFGCGGLRDVNLIVKDITLSEGAFSGGYDPYSSHYGYCDNLTNVIVAASNRVEFGVSVFAGCSALQQVMLTAGAEMDVGATAFSGCTALRQTTLTAGSEMKVGASAFSSGSGDHVSYSSCNHLTNVLMTASNRVELGSSAFFGCTALQHAELTAGEQISVGASAFSSCTALQQVSLAASEPSSFGDSVFSNCKALQVIELPEGLVGVPQNAFYSCSSLQSVSLSSNVASIAYRAFDTCTSLTNVWMSEGLSVIESQAFYGSALKRLELPQSVSSVGSRAFEMCGGLESVLVREGDTNRLEATSLAIGERAFYRCNALTDVRLPQRTTVLPARVFADCERLASINLPSNLTDIAESAFESCAALPGVDFPTKLASIGAMAFNGCAALTGFSIPTNRIVDLGDKAFVGTKYWNEWPDNSLVVNNGYILGFKGNPTSVELPEGCVAIPAEMFKGMTALTNVVVPASVKKVGLRAFAGSGVRTVVISNVTEIGVSAFEGCTNLTAIVLGEGLGGVPNSAFLGCTSLQAIDIPESVRSIGAEAFQDCVALRNVSGGEGVVQVGDYAFAGCVILQPFRFVGNVAYGDHVFQFVEWKENVLFPSIGTMAQEYPKTYADVRSVVFSSLQAGIVDRACAGCASLELINIPNGVVSVGASAFEGCGSLTSVVLSASVSNVGSNAFNGCDKVISLVTSGRVPVKDMFPALVGDLKDIRIASGTTSLCDSALAGCMALSDVELPSSVSAIGAFALSGCTGLTQIDVPEGVKSIADGAFCGCENLYSVRMRGHSTSVSTNAFVQCPSVRSIWMPIGAPLKHLFPDSYRQISLVKFLEDVTAIPDNAFRDCVSLSEFDIPETVFTIGSAAFAGCTEVKELVMPVALGSIGDNAFRNCTGLKTVKFMGPQPLANPSIYAGTPKDLWSKVRYAYRESWATNDVMLPARWPVPESAKDGDFANTRRIGWWMDSPKDDDADTTITFYYYDTTGRRERIGGGDWPGDPSREGYDFLGWFTKPYGGIQVESAEDCAELGVTSIYAHWVLNRGGDYNDPQEWDDVVYNVKKAYVYDGYLLDGDEIAGTIQVKTAKGRYDRESGDTSVNVTAAVMLLGEGKKVSLKGVAEFVGEEGGGADLVCTKSSDDREGSVEFAPNDLSGYFDGYEIVGARNMFGENTDWDKRTARAAIDDWGGSYVVALEANGDDSLSQGYVALTIKVSNKGKCRVSGALPDGTKVSASCQLLVAEDHCELPVVVPLYSGKKGGFGFNVIFSQDEGLLVENVSDWTAIPSKDYEFSSTLTPAGDTGIWIPEALESSAHFLLDSTPDIPDVDVDYDLLPTDVGIQLSGKRWVLPKADTVKFVKDEGYVIAKGNGNPAGLKLTFTASTGMFKGSFKVYAVTEDGKSKKYSAQVTGAVVNGVGYGTAVIKKVCSMPVNILLEE